MSEANQLVAPSDVAALAGVSRAAVSNWRKRSPDFPKAVGGTAAKPLFDRAEIEEWLRANDKSVSPRRDEISLWALLNSVRNLLPPDEGAALAHAVLCARKLTLGDDSRWRQFRAATVENAGASDSLEHFVHGQAAADGRWESTVGAVISPATPTDRRLDHRKADLLARLADIASGLNSEQLADTSDYILERAAGAMGKAAGWQGLVRSTVSAVLADLAVSRGDSIATVYDPACGIAETFVRINKKSKSVKSYVGVDINLASATFARQRCLLHDVDAEIIDGDTLQADMLNGLRADAVVAEPPFSLRPSREFELGDPRWGIGGIPPRNNADFAWIQIAIHHLTAAGAAFVVTGAGATFVRQSAKIRSSLLRAGCIEAVIGLPPRLLPHTSISLVIWVLRPPGTTDEVTFVDASDVDPSQLDASQWLSRSARNTGPPSATLTIEELDNDEAVLSPARWARPEASREDAEERLDSAREAFRNIGKRITSVRLHGDSLEIPAARQKATLGELIRRGAVDLSRTSIQNRDSLNSSLEVDDGVVTPAMVTHGLPQVAGSLHPSADETQTGDILLTDLHKVRTVVDTTGGRTLKSGVTRLRVDPEQLDPNYVAACLEAPWNQWSRESGLPRIPLKELTIPLIPLDQQRNVVQEITRLDEVARTADELAAAARQMQSAVLDSIHQSSS